MKRRGFLQAIFGAPVAAAAGAVLPAAAEVAKVAEFIEPSEAVYAGGYTGDFSLCFTMSVCDSITISDFLKSTNAR